MIFYTGLAALTKVLISSEEKTIPANLHYNNPNPDIPGLVDGRLSVVSTNTSWDGGLVAINSFGFGGTNVHSLLNTHVTHDKVRGKHTCTEVVFSSQRQLPKQDFASLYLLAVCVYIKMKYLFTM